MAAGCLPADGTTVTLACGVSPPWESLVGRPLGTLALPLAWRLEP
jgi:hypothetical protein